MNQFNGTGHLCASPITTEKEEGKKYSVFTISIRRRNFKEGEPNCDFLRCVCFRQQADFAQKYLKKSMKVEVSGEIRIEPYERDGIHMTSVKLLIEKLGFAESKAANEKYASESSPVPEDHSFLDMDGEEVFSEEKLDS